jgi:glyoxylase-like metal-dependent hydrolase (beta-lactamase superfamily II)
VETITENVHHLPELVGGPTLILADDFVTLVDTGVPDSETAIFEALESLGRKPRELAHVLITHADGDHVGSLAAIVEETAARVYAGAHEADVIEGKRPTRGGDVRDGYPVDERVEPGQTIPLHGGILVVPTFGHTLGHLSFYLATEDVLIAGDCVSNRDGLAGSPPHLTADAVQAAEAIRILAAVRPGSACFGHGPSVVGNAAEQLEGLATAN